MYHYRDRLHVQLDEYLRDEYSALIGKHSS